MDTVDVDGLRIAYERTGRGPALVLLHGYVGDGATTWRPQLDALSDDFTVVAWDAPGAGRSSDPPEDFGMEGYADAAAGFVRALGLEGSFVGGLSFGGALVIALAARHPRVAVRVVLASAYAGWRGSLGEAAAEQRLAQAVRLSELSPDELVATLLPTMFSEGTPAEVVDAFEATIRAVRPVGFRAMARASAEDLRPDLSSVKAPALLVYGDQDVRAPLSVAEHLVAAMPRAELVVLSGVGHVCNIEAPHAFNEAVRAFLGRRDG
jgi:pimeloyl-ACP methyl ester carboxylesterase